MTTGTYSFASVILNADSVDGLFVGVISAKAQFLDQVKTNSISQLINSINDGKVNRKLLKCFSGIATSVSFLPTLFAS